MLLADASDRLRAAGVPSPEWDARLLAAHVLGVNHMAVPADQHLPAEVEALIDRRAQREPLQHIVGTAPFGPLDLAVGPGVFIPRPETEVLADWAVRQLADVREPVVVDLCAGSGALGLYVATQVPDAHVIAVEKDPAAVAWLHKNVASFAPQVQVVQADATDSELLPELQSRVDLVVTNPPYVPETPDLEPEVYADPEEAVFAGPDGMTVIVALLPVIAGLLRPGGIVGIEHDESTGSAVAAALEAQGSFGNIEAMPDLTGRARFSTARRGNI